LVRITGSEIRVLARTGCRQVYYEILLIPVLLIFSALFSGSETALFSLSPVKVKTLQAEKKRRGRLIAHLLSNPRRLLITILIGNMFVNTFASSLSASLFRSLSARWDAPVGTSDFMSVLVMTTLILIFGEISPKIYAIHHSERLATRVAPFLRTFSAIVRPVRAVLERLADGIWRLFTIAVKPEEPGASEEELRTAVRIGVAEGFLDPHEEAMIQGLFEIETSQVREMMKSRTEIFSLDLSTPIEDIRKAFREKKYTRVPIHTGDIDNVLGLLYAKDLLFASRTDLEKSGIRPLLRPVFFVPETASVERLLKEFRARATHFALVVDEYGSVSGLITMEDVLQSLIGRFGTARPESSGRVLSEGDTAVISARMPLGDFNERFSCSISDDLSVTVGGFLTRRMGKIPRPGEIYETDEIRFEIKSATKNRIEDVLVKRRKRSREQ
jgi:putative hemolysin